jgi:DNA invertase Pin-like site-specific DNA recombinase
MTSNTAGAPSKPLLDQARRVAQRHNGGRRKSRREDWAGQTAAIYCRISHIKDEDQTGVDRQERLCRETAKRLGLTVHDRFVFVDNNRSAWQRKRKRPGWDKLLAAAKSGEVQHILCYHPDRLMRQPKDLEELLEISDDYEITMHGQANQRDLADSDDRFFLRIEVAHACKSSDDTSRRVLDATMDRAAAGLPHTGKRRYGYTPDGMTIVEDEAKIVKEVFRRYLDGEAPETIAADLSARKIPAARGGAWMGSMVRDLLDNRHVAGIRVYQGQEIGQGAWPAIISAGVFAEVRAKRHGMRQAASSTRRRRFYTLRGVVTCARCATSMGGSSGASPSYRCGRIQRNDELHCTNQIGALKLEDFVRDEAVRLLTKLDPAGRVSQATSTPGDEAKITKYRKEIAEAKQAWKDEDFTLAEYREIKRDREKKIAEAQPKTIVRPTAEVLKGLTGPNAPIAWKKLEKAEDYERMNAVFRFLFAEVKISKATTKRGVFDFGRINIKQNPL